MSKRFSYILFSGVRRTSHILLGVASMVYLAEHLKWYVIPLLALFLMASLLLGVERELDDYEEW